MSQTIDFKYGSETNFGNLSQKEAGTVYFVKDDTVNGGTIYRGTEALGTTVADKLILSEDLDVFGIEAGTFADDSIKDGYTFDAGMSVMDVLKKLLQKEIFPTNATCTIPNTYTVSFPNLSVGTQPSGYAIVGTTVDVSGVSVGVPTGSTPSITFGGFTHGYKTSPTATSVTTGNPSSIGYTASPNSNCSYSLKADYTGFSSQADDTQTGSYSAMPTISEKTLTVGLGSNSVKYTASASTNAYTATPNTSGAVVSYYPVSNMGNYDATQAAVVSTTTSAINSSDPADKSSSTYTVTGVYPVLYSTTSTGTGTMFELGNFTEKKFNVSGTTIIRVMYPTNRTCDLYYANPLDQNDATRWTKQATATVDAEYEDYSVNNKEYDCLTLSGDVANGEYKIVMSKNTVTE